MWAWNHLPTPKTVSANSREWVCLHSGWESDKNLLCLCSELVGWEPALIWKFHGEICIAGWPCAWSSTSLWGTYTTYRSEAFRCTLHLAQILFSAVQPYEMSSPGNAFKKKGLKHNQNLSCHPPPLHRKDSIYFINNTDSSVRHQITPAITGPVHRISKLFLFAFASQHRRIFQSREYTLELWVHAIGKYGEQRENLWGKFCCFQKRAVPGRIFARIMLSYPKH